MAGAPPVRLRPPLDEAQVLALAAGQEVLISGAIYGARDRAHARLVELLRAGRPLPFDPRGAIIYYVGPTPAPPGRPLGSAGPTTAARMDAYAPALHEAGIKATIGKGDRSPAFLADLRRARAVYLAALGGAGALLSRAIVAAEVIAFPELGLEALRRLEVVDFPALVAADCRGGDIFAAGRKQWERQERERQK